MIEPAPTDLSVPMGGDQPWSFFERALVLTDSSRKRLLDDKVWVDRQGERHLVSELEPSHARNIMKMFDKIRNALYNGVVSEYVLGECPFSGEIATDSYYHAMDEVYEMKPEQWLWEQPLYKALAKRAAQEEESKCRNSIRGHQARLERPAAQYR